MTTVSLKGNSITLSGTPPQVGDKAPDFTVTKTDLSSVALKDYYGKVTLLNVFPSIDTPTCSASARRFNEALGQSQCAVLCISMDLPFAHKRFCEAEGIKNIILSSDFKDRNFGKNYGLVIQEGPMKGLLARAIFVLDPEGKIVYEELVPEITQSPDYEKVLGFLEKFK